MKVETYASREAWLEARKASLGASDIPPILGAEGAYRTRLEVWAEKTGKTDGDPPPSIRQQVGLCLEPLILKLFEEETGRTAVHAAEGGELLIVRSDTLPIHCSPDATVDGKPLEIKSVGAFAHNAWKERIPDHPVLQLAAQMLVMEQEGGTIAGLIQGSTLLWRDFEANARLQQAIADECGAFWDHHIVKDIPPDPVPKDVQFIRSLFPESKPVTIDLPGVNLDDMVDRWESLDTEIKWREMARDEAKGKIMLALGDAEMGRTERGRLVTWRSDKRGQRSLRRKRSG